MTAGKDEDNDMICEPSLISQQQQLWAHLSLLLLTLEYASEDDDRHESLCLMRTFSGCTGTAGEATCC